ncbi:MAG: hypothetical protein QOG75_4941, partial [Mycobacterium sp.]|nr:hypothetical protein [Mycobacterium sp.]
DGAALLHRPAAATGVDPSGTVEVRVDDAGRLSQVDVHRDWGRRVGDALGQAVLAAFSDAVTRRAAQWATAMSGPPVSESPGDHDPAPHRRSSPRAGDAQRAQMLRELTELMDGALGELDALAERLETLAQRAVEGRSPTGRVTARLTGTHLTGLEIALRWLRLGPTGREIGAEIEAACREAYETQAGLAADAAAQASHTAAVRELARDPHEFVRRLGLA